MKKIFSSKKMDNRGSALFLVMAATLFVMLMASTVLAVAYSNIMLKRVGKTANQAFYTAETAVDEIYSGLGDCALQSVSDAYMYQLSEIVQDDKTIVDNAVANKAMKKKFVESYLKAITSNTETLTATGTYLANSTINQDKLVLIENYLNDYLTGVVGASGSLTVESVGAFTATANDPDYILEIKDVVINYQSSTDYFSDITTDFMIKYPELNVAFNNNVPDDFLDYCLIAENNLAFGNFNTNLSGTSNATTVSANANAGLYAGKNLNINNGSNLILANSAKAVAHANDDTHGVGVISGTTASTLSVGNAILWSGGDINLSGEKLSSTGAILNTTADTMLYVKDDLEFNSDGSSASVNGAYYGYGNGYSLVNGLSNADEDNASMIMNARFGTLTVNTNALELLGHAYIQTVLIEDMVSNVTSSGYENGESVNIKYIQSIYMVQDTFLKSSATNPVGTASSLVTPDATNNYPDLVDYTKLKNEFFAYSLLDATTPVILAKDETKNLYYIYYNFKTSESREQYAKAIQTGVLNGVSVEANTSYREEKSVSERGINKQFYEYGSGAYIGRISIASANSRILGTYPSSMYADATGSHVTWNDGNLTDTQAKTRSGQIEVELKTKYGMMANNTVFDTIIYRDRVEGVGATGYSDTFTMADGTVYDLIVTNTQSPEITSTRGIIIHNGTGTLTLENNFHGLIISDGTITVKGNATLTTDRNAVDYILSNDADFQKFFKYYSPNTDDEFSIEKIGYGDIIYIQNWRKFED